MKVRRPRARRQGLLVRDLGDEIVVYELDAHRGHCLNPAAALVWRACDGRSTVAEIAARVGRDLGAPPDTGLVRYALRVLRDAKLLDPASAEGPCLARREVARRLGQAALLPAVISLVAPTPSEAATCEAGCPTCNCSGQPNGTTCWNGVDCSSYVCCNGSCVPPGPC